ncbi:DNA-binding IclR family transcriptional regulator [Hydrogenophaga palleronii]|uniref:DNA-binding IclR family transcriptional regulator n=1 Tax=Hydrogenophaga palleronii TaxID=65655 RepID=A0ABU1WQ79_9BURK|nr:IclR family transcriptional regulator [Hydrogenophaga palleronii]MDR7151364.1 DNA-binding IclR family transcriptional regulator [Hydrogenophaga palleronii]
MPAATPKPRGRRPKTSEVTPDTAIDDRYRAPALDKGLDILELLATQPHGLTRAEIVKEMDRSASEIYRMLERLVARQYVMRTPSGDRYALSLKLFALAHMHPPLSRLINQALPIMDDFTRKAEQSCHMGVYDRGNVLISAQINSPSGWSFAVQRGARVGLLDTASGHLLLAFADEGSFKRMLAEHTPVDGEVPTTLEALQATLASIRERGYLERDSAQTQGVVDISFPILGPDNTALATLTCPYIRRIDRHVGPEMAQVREYLRAAARALSLTQGMNTA